LNSPILLPNIMFKMDLEFLKNGLENLKSLGKLNFFPGGHPVNVTFNITTGNLKLSSCSFACRRQYEARRQLCLRLSSEVRPRDNNAMVFLC